MNREEFMKQLEQLLSDISQEEREEALAFYNNYFEDAGVENEAQIIKELRSPEKVAQSIKDDLVANVEYSKNGEYTERGYKDADENKESIIAVKSSVHEEKQQTEDDNQQGTAGYQNTGYQQDQRNDGYQQNQGNNGYQYNPNQSNGYQYNQGQNNGYQNNGGQQNGYQNNGYQQNGYQNNGYQNNGYQNNGYQNNGYQQNGYQQNGYQNNGYQNTVVEKKTNVPMLILICVFALPVILPLTLAAFSTVFGLVVGFGAAAAGCTIAGFVVTILGIAKLVTVPALGFIAIGGGLVVFGIGLLFALATAAVAKLFPLLCRVVGAIFKAPVTERRVSA